VALRYFNAAGADPDGELGEMHDPETHLIPLTLFAALGRQPSIKVFGSDYPTPDGTCVRDYVHVSDLADAHVAALEWLAAGSGSSSFNLGNGRGFSVAEVIHTSEEVTGLAIKTELSPRRSGDPAVLLSDSTKAQNLLKWQPRFPDLRQQIDHAWNGFALVQRVQRYEIIKALELSHRICELKSRVGRLFYLDAAGIPHTLESLGTSRLTSDIAPITTQSPMVMPFCMTDCGPI
jgi:UDP-glucose 4-epimerase